MTHQDIQVIVGEVSSDFLEFRGQSLPSASHITLPIKLFHSSKIQATTEIPVCVCVSVIFKTV